MGSLHFLPFEGCHFFELRPLSGVSQCMNVSVGSADEFRDEEADAHSGMNGEPYGVHNTDDGALGRGDHGKFDKVADMVEV